MHLTVSIIGNYSSFPACFMSTMSAGVVANEEAEKASPSAADHTDATAAEPAYADQSTRLLPPSKIVIVSNLNPAERSAVELIVLIFA